MAEFEMAKNMRAEFNVIPFFDLPIEQEPLIMPLMNKQTLCTLYEFLADTICL
jgi:hypothetical protein